MKIKEKIGRTLAKTIDKELSNHGLDPCSFYRNHQLSRQMWRIRTGRSFSSKGIESILLAAKKEGVETQYVAI